MLAFAIALHLPTPTPLGDRPFLSVPTYLGDRPPDTFWNLELLTQIYRDLKFATYSKVFGSVRLDPDLEEPSLCKWGANRLPTDKLTEPER
ncbi:hypothetical protein [Leptolyngbya sp. O-77]|uniref:hypothetical protein n=1 Tax=Leptolyngbya sp. O-77 TaxID=1080068 RepID=UPI00074D4376|nr:hypothetical protein [Leptolyngbya sp. O-77]BAU42964.1 hypothetical protein O77CONTIG1_02786 [Leptolyngbya sp. O-77]